MDDNAEKRSFIILLLVIGAAVFFAFTGRDSRSAPANTIFSITTPLDNLEWEIQLYQEYLQRTDIPEDMKWGFQRKIEILELEQTREVLAETTTPIIPSPLELAPKGAKGTRPVGILDEFPIPPRSNFVVTNAWQALVNGEYVMVVAGFIKDDPEQGAVFYQTPDGPHVVVKTSKKSGELKIKEVKGKKIVLVSKKGDTFYFDVPGRKFITTLDEVVATVTPSSRENEKPKELTPTPPAYPFPVP